MGYADRSYSYRPGRGPGGPAGGGGGLLGSFSMTPWVRRLLIANGAVWLLNWVGLLPHLWTIETFGFAADGVLTRPWSPLTYMFVHGGFWHVFVNMLVLFFFGPPLERAWGGREFLKYYLVAGLGGALVSVLLLPTEVVAGETMVVGASGAIYGVMLAFGLEWPEAKVYIWGILPLRAKWFVAILAAVTIVSTASAFGGGGGRVAHWAHLGGLVTGFAYLRWGTGLSRALDGVFDRVEAAASALGPSERGGRTDGGASGPRGNGRRTPSSGSGGGREIAFPAGRTDDEDRDEGGRRPDEDTLDEVDRILDKIRERGLESLTDEEREFLDEMSRRYRG